MLSLEDVQIQISVVFGRRQFISKVSCVYIESVLPPVWCLWWRWIFYSVHDFKHFSCIWDWHLWHLFKTKHKHAWHVNTAKPTWCIANLFFPFWKDPFSWGKACDFLQTCILTVLCWDILDFSFTYIAISNTVSKRTDWSWTFCHVTFFFFSI